MPAQSATIVPDEKPEEFAEYAGHGGGKYADLALPAPTEVRGFCVYSRSRVTAPDSVRSASET